MQCRFGCRFSVHRALNNNGLVYPYVTSSREETTCRFCSSVLPDWKTPGLEAIQPVIVVYFEGVIHPVPVRHGPGAKEEFTEKIRELFNINAGETLILTFGAHVPQALQPAGCKVAGET